jgi:glycerol-3-phosphate dehydrogenase subunit C
VAARTARRGALRTDFRPLPMKLPYHAPCQQRAHRVGKPALELMALIPGLEIAESHARCCGIAGTYGYKVEKYQIAMDVGAELFDFVASAGREMFEYTACDSGAKTCRWQLESMALDLPSRHPIEILAAGLRSLRPGARTMLRISPGRASRLRRNCRSKRSW